ncbi:MAG TPA: hypothetical protein VH280_00010 [Verrucomicrobiae bacterium]|jgi:hypothetical protein|nr:hypothetical protein [Verrucomicrobiae bacterium]
MTHIFETTNAMLNSIDAYAEDFANARAKERAIALLAERFVQQARALMAADINVCHPELDTFSPLASELRVDPWSVT